MRRAALRVSDVRGRADQVEQRAWRRRQLGIDTRQIEREVGIDLVTLRRRRASREVVDIKVDKDWTAACASSADAIGDDMPCQHRREGRPAAAVRIEALTALQHRDQDVLTKIVPISTRKGEAASATPGLLGGDSKAGREPAGVPGGG